MAVVQFIKDENVSPALDAKLIALLSACFTDPEFKERRYFKECPQYRWYIEDNGVLVAHAAVHDKVITAGQEKIKVGGIAEVCVLPAHRGKGYVRDMLKVMDAWMKERGFDFGMLFGKTEVYSSSGYYDINNEISYIDYKTNKLKTEKSDCGMVKPLSGKPWPAGTINLNGPTF